MTLNLSQRSSKVIEIRRLKCRKSTIFPTQLLFRLKFGGVPFGVDPSMGSTESEMVRLISREIISQISNLYDHDTSTLQTDGQADGQTLLALAIPRYA